MGGRDEGRGREEERWGRVAGDRYVHTYIHTYIHTYLPRPGRSSANRGESSPPTDYPILYIACALYER